MATPGNLASEVSIVPSVGKVVRANTPWKSVEKWMEDLLLTLKKLLVGVELWTPSGSDRRYLSKPPYSFTILMIPSVNIDINAKNCKQDGAVKNSVWSFSAAYQNYMNNLFDDAESSSINPIVQ
ncbi:hypothetical protein ACKLNR_003587 [Fusarium oxysporum f. sp. zingiberi]